MPPKIWYIDQEEEGKRLLTEIQSLANQLTLQDQDAMLRLYHESRRRTDSKRLSANKMYQNTIPDMLKNFPPMIIKNGKEFRRLTFIDVVLSPPIEITGNGSCEKQIPLICMLKNKGYTSDLFVFLKEEIFLMEDPNGKFQFETRQMQQEKRRAAIEAKSNEGISALNLYGEVVAETTAMSANEHSNISDHYFTTTPPTLEEHYKNQKQTEQYTLPSEMLMMDSNKLIELFGKKVSEHIYPYVKLFDMPVLTKSVLDNMNEGIGTEHGECLMEEGASFITKAGVEKVLMFRYAMIPNMIFVRYKKDQRHSQFHSECRSEHIGENRSTSTFYMNYVPDKILTVDDNTGNLANIGSMVCRISAKLQNIPLIIWIRALGLETDDEIRTVYKQVCGSPAAKTTNNTSYTSFQRKVLERCLQDHRGCHTTHSAILYLGGLLDGKTNAEKWFLARKKLRTEVLPHIGKKTEPESVFQKQCLSKARFLLFMLRDTLMAVEFAYTYPAIRSKDNPFLTNRDSDKYRQFQTTDELLAPLIHQYLKQHLTKFVIQTILKKLDRGMKLNYYEIFYLDKITTRLNYNISMGEMKASPAAKSQFGVSQNIQRQNYVDTIAQHDKIMNPVHKEGKQIGPRLLGETAYGIVCSSDTPEGASAGLNRQMGQFVHQAIGTSPELVTRLLMEKNQIADSVTLVWSYDDPDIQHILNDSNTLMWNVFVNKINIGFTIVPDATLRYIRMCRRDCVISNETTASYGDFSDPADVCIDSIAPSQDGGPIAFAYTHGTDSKTGKLLPFDELQPYLNPVWRKQAAACRKFDIHIRTHSARNLRELFVVENLYKLGNKPIELWKHHELLAEGIVEYVDVEETCDLYIASELSHLQSNMVKWQSFQKKFSQFNCVYPSSKRTHTFTHLEIHPSNIYGLCAGMIPGAQSNPSARNAFQSHMGKAAQGKATTNSKTHRMDTNYNELWYPQRPEVSTALYEVLDIYRLSTSYNGYIRWQCSMNEEDSQETNACTMEIGFGSSSNYHTIVVQERKQKNKLEKIGLFAPDQCSKYKIGCDYSKLDEMGIIRDGTVIKKHTVLVQRNANGEDTSIVYNGHKPATVDGVIWFWNDQNLLVVKVRLREARRAEVGDKNASRHSQKGLISRMRRRENMLYNSTTFQFADLIYNSCAKISRQTMAMMRETDLATLSAHTAKFADDTPMTNNWIKLLEHTDIHSIHDEHHRQSSKDMSQDEADLFALREIGKEFFAKGFHPYLSFSQIDGRTGKRVRDYGLAFEGFVTLQKLRQMMADKTKARGQGPISYSTKQPTAGKSTIGEQDGGNKIGGMEEGCLAGHGSREVIYERMLLSSDRDYAHVCEICSHRTIYQEKQDKNYCSHCEQSDTALNVLGSATFNLFQDELSAMGTFLLQHVKRKSDHVS